MNDATHERLQAGAPAPDAPSTRTTRALPEGTLIILPVRGMVMFPWALWPLSIEGPRLQQAVQEALRQERPLGVLMQSRTEAANAAEPGPDDLHWIGTSALVLRYVTGPDGTHHAVLRGLQRFRALRFLDGWPFLVAQVQTIEEAERSGPEIEGRARALKQRARETANLLPQLAPELIAGLDEIDDPARLADVIGGLLDIPAEDKQLLLETFDLAKRMDRLLELLAHRIEVLKVSRDVAERTREAIGDVNRKHLLREQMRTIQKELGEDEEGRADTDELEQAITRAQMPEEAEKAARKELKRLQRMPEGAAEHSMVRTYLEWLTELPWALQPGAPIDIAQARRILDEDHFGLEKVKKRILEYLAVQKLHPEGRSPILCFVGPPGVGKTSLGQSIARATGRVFARVSLGGVHDESEIRGHRRTYVGALPGTIIQSLRKAGTRNPLMMLDEVDKLGAGGFHGDPAAALLEVLDPAQNATFQDTYLALPFDLSQVMFVCTANVLDTIPGPLRDRMEVIQLPGYTAQEKLQIARRHLLPRQLKANGLGETSFAIDDGALRRVIDDYTREAGVRQLEREIGSVLRSAAVRIAEGRDTHVSIGPGDLQVVLGPPRHEAEVALRAGLPGVATGLAWTPVGGDILFIEAARMAGSGKLILTGQLGEVMKESAQAALSLVKARLPALGTTAEALDRSDIHIHVPAGATPKDGPSAGVAMFVALVSLISGRPVHHDVAMTGEISLRGLVLPVGGIKEKVLAAQRAGIGTVLLPARNLRDLEDIPADVREQLRFVPLEHVDGALAQALPELQAADVATAAPG